MITPRSLLHALLEKALSWTGALHAQGTGSWYQAGLLRLMGAAVEGPVAIAPGTSFLGTNNLKLGRYVTIGAASRIVSWVPVTIGDDFMASDRLTVNSGDHDPVTLQPRLTPVKIGNRVWCGAGVTICAGVEIGDDVVIGAGSLVTRSIPANTIAYGTPAKPMRPLSREADTPLWSMWPERSPNNHYSRSTPLRQWAHRLLARI